MSSPDLASPESAGLEQKRASYPGGKNGAGVYQRLINLIPPHRVWIECFFGSGALTRWIRRASTSYGIDVDATVIGKAVHDPAFDGVNLSISDSLEWLPHHFERNRLWTEDNPTFVYADPPYLGRTRCHGQRSLYRNELLTVNGHERLLQILTSIPARVMISGYRCRLYNRLLSDWTRVDYQAMTRGGLKDEAVWFNYPTPTELHDYRYLGEDFRERHRIARKIKRWVGKLSRMPVLERAAVIAGCNAAAGGADGIADGR